MSFGGCVETPASSVPRAYPVSYPEQWERVTTTKNKHDIYPGRFTVNDILFETINYMYIITCVCVCVGTQHHKIVFGRMPKKNNFVRKL